MSSGEEQGAKEFIPVLLGVVQRCSKGAKRCYQVETGVPLGTQGKPHERMGVDKKMYMKEGFLEEVHPLPHSAWLGMLGLEGKEGNFLQMERSAKTVQCICRVGRQ